MFADKKHQNTISKEYLGAAAEEVYKQIVSQDREIDPFDINLQEEKGKYTLILDVSNSFNLEKFDILEARKNALKGVLYDFKIFVDKNTRHQNKQKTTYTIILTQDQVKDLIQATKPTSAPAAKK